MTNPPEGRDGSSPSVAALAVHVNGLRRNIESLTGQVEALTSTQRQHALLLDGLAERRSQIDHILAIITEQDQDSPATWFWLTMPDHERDEKLSELADWVETVLYTQYPDYLTNQIRPCWPNHPEVRWELAWLYQLWSQAYPAQRPAPKNAADWHDRWAPGVIRRLGTVMRRCEQACQRQPDLTAIDDLRHPVPP